MRYHISTSFVLVLAFLLLSVVRRSFAAQQQRRNQQYYNNRNQNNQAQQYYQNQNQQQQQQQQQKYYNPYSQYNKVYQNKNQAQQQNNQYSVNTEQMEQYVQYYNQNQQDDQQQEQQEGGNNQYYQAQKQEEDAGYEYGDYYKWGGTRGYYDQQYVPYNGVTQVEEYGYDDDDDDDDDGAAAEEVYYDDVYNIYYDAAAAVYDSATTFSFYNKPSGNNYAGTSSSSSSYNQQGANYNNNNNNKQQQQQEGGEAYGYYEEFPKGSFYFDGDAECSGSSYNLMLTDLQLSCYECKFNSEITLSGSINTTSALPRFVQLLPRICDGSGSDCTDSLLKNSYISLCRSVEECRQPGNHSFSMTISIPTDDGTYVAGEDKSDRWNRGGGYRGRRNLYNRNYNNNKNYNNRNNNNNNNNQYHSFTVKVFLRPVTNFRLWKAMTGVQDDDFWERDQEYPEWWQEGYQDQQQERSCWCFEDDYGEGEDANDADKQNSQYYYVDGEYQKYGEDVQWWEMDDYYLRDREGCVCDCDCPQGDEYCWYQCANQPYDYQYQNKQRYQNGQSVNAKNGDYSYRYKSSQYYDEKHTNSQNSWMNNYDWRQDFYNNPTGHMYCYMHFGLVGRGDLNLTAYSPGNYSTWWKQGGKWYNYSDFRRYFRYVFASLGAGSLLSLAMHFWGKQRRLICACDEDTSYKEEEDTDLEGSDMHVPPVEQTPPPPRSLKRVSGNIDTQKRPQPDSTEVQPRMDILPAKDGKKGRNSLPAKKGKGKGKGTLQQATAATKLLSSSPTSRGKKKKSPSKGKTPTPKPDIMPSTDILPPKPKTRVEKGAAAASSDYYLI